MPELVSTAPVLGPSVGLLASAWVDPAPLPRLEALTEDGLPIGGYQLRPYCSPVNDVLDYGFADRGPGVGVFRPFVVEASDSCSTMGGYRADEGAVRARAKLDRVLSAALARELWTGELAEAAGHATAGPSGSLPLGTGQADEAHASLAGYVAANPGNDLTGAGGAVPVRVGVGLLEEALGEVLGGARGMVHCPVAVAGFLEVRRSGATWLTRVDNDAVLDAGYPGSGPDGAAPTGGERWLYATGPVAVRLGPVEEEGAYDRAINTATAVAVRPAAVSFLGPAFAVRVTLV